MSLCHASPACSRGLSGLFSCKDYQRSATAAEAFVYLLGIRLLLAWLTKSGK